MTILIRNCNLIDMKTGDCILDSAILLDKDKIVAINPKNINNLNKAEVIDANGGWILPGLSDVHVHICHEGTPNLQDPFHFLNQKLILF